MRTLAQLQELKLKTITGAVSQLPKWSQALPSQKPANVTETAYTLQIAGGSFMNWDTEGKALELAGKVKVDNVAVAGVRGGQKGLPLAAVRLRAGCVAEINQSTFFGTFGQGRTPDSMILAERNSNGTWPSLIAFTKNRSEGWGADHMKLYGSLYGESLIMENYFGPQWALQGTRPHSDVFTTVAAQGTIRLQENYIEHDMSGYPIGVNNVFRFVRVVNDPLYWLLVTGNAFKFGAFHSFPIQAAKSAVGGGPSKWVGPIDFEDNYMQANAAGKYFHPSTNKLIRNWKNKDWNGKTIIGPTGSVQS